MQVGVHVYTLPAVCTAGSEQNADEEPACAGGSCHEANREKTNSGTENGLFGC